MADWRKVGFTFYNDPPGPAAGNLKWGGYSFAELGTATKRGEGTGVGNLAKAFGLGGQERLGSEWSLYAGHNVIVARLEDHGYGQGSDPIHSDPHYAVDLYDGHAFGLPNLVAALGVGGSGTVWIRRGRWHPPESLPTGGTRPAPNPLVGLRGAVDAGTDPPDHSAKVTHSGRRLGVVGSQLQGHARALQHLAHRPLKP